MNVLSGKKSRVLVIGDIHAPYHNPSAWAFLKAVKEHFGIDSQNPEHLVISIGDEIDGQAWSFHNHDPELYSPGAEYRKARTFLKNLEKLFPLMNIIESNHGSLHLRKQKAYGLPKGFFKDYNEAWDVGPGWKWMFDLTVELSNGSLCYFHHGRSNNVLRVSQTMGMNVVQGHYHEQMGAQYWSSPAGTFWAAQTGCLIDPSSSAMAYAKNNLKKPVLGSLVIINGYPISIPLITDKRGEWIGRIT